MTENQQNELPYGSNNSDKVKDSWYVLLFWQCEYIYHCYMTDIVYY